MKLATESRATASRLRGLRSSAAMLVELSTASTMSMPFVRISSSAAPDWGRASPTISRPSAATLSAMGRCRRRVAAEGGIPAKSVASGNLTLPFARRCARQ